MQRVYYNEFNPYASQWLKNLISNGDLPHGDVDTRSITEVQAHELQGYEQLHFFAGIGGWPIALKIAGWGDRPVWTGSCPCQSYSNAGKKSGNQDERHLWPTWFNLIQQQQASTVFGEQVANAITYGWLDEVFHDLEGKAYSCASAVLRACGVNSPHERRRLFFVAQSSIDNDCGASGQLQKAHEQQAHERPQVGDAKFSDAIDFPPLVECRDGFKRQAKPEFLMLVNGFPDILDIEQAFGNAIQVELAAKFIKSYMEATCQ